MSEFVGTNLRLIRLFHDLSLTDLGEQVGVSKQFLSRVETSAEVVSATLEAALADALAVLPDFFYRIDPNPIVDEQCHFRHQLTTKVALRQVARARGEILKRLVGVLDEHVDPFGLSLSKPAPALRQAQCERSCIFEREAVWIRRCTGRQVMPRRAPLQRPVGQ